MGKLRNFVTPLHTQTQRDYLARMMDDKVACMAKAKEYGKDFWDGDRRYGYGGYRYDGRWRRVAKQMIEIYDLPDDARILDVGCGKGYLLYEFKQLLPKAVVSGFDISAYAVENSRPEIRPFLFTHDARNIFPFADQTFDLLVSITTLHNLEIFELESTIKEIERVGRHKYICVESFRNDKELFNLQCWALTCSTFLTPKSWEWFFRKCGYQGDFEFIFFE